MYKWFKWCVNDLCSVSARVNARGYPCAKGYNSSASQWLSREQVRLCSGHLKVHFGTIVEGSWGVGGARWVFRALSLLSFKYSFRVATLLHTDDSRAPSLLTRRRGCGRPRRLCRASWQEARVAVAVGAFVSSLSEHVSPEQLGGAPLVEHWIATSGMFLGYGACIELRPGHV